MGGFNPKQLQEMMSAAKQQADQLQRKMQDTVVEGTAGGSVTVKMNGQKHVLSITIDPEVVKSGDVEMLQDMVMAAVNAAAQKADEAMQSGLGGMLGGLQGLL